MSEPVLKHIAIGDINVSPDAIRTVNEESAKFKEILDSVRSKGVINPIAVREIKDSEGNKSFEILEGLHRYTSCKAIGKETIPAAIHANVDDSKAVEMMIVGNHQKQDTKPHEYAKGLRTWLVRNPNKTMGDLSKLLSCSASFLQQRLNLLKLSDEAANLVNKQLIPLSKAAELARLPVERQGDFIDQAQQSGANIDDFKSQIATAIKKIRDANKKGRDSEPSVFVAKPIARKFGDLREELESHTVAKELPKMLKLKTAQEGFEAGVAWALQMDDKTLQLRKEEWEKAEKARTEKAAAAKAERDQKKKEKALQEAKEKQAELEKDLKTDPVAV